MSSWRDSLLQEFAPQVARLTLAADPDGLLAEGELLAAIRAAGFEVLTYDDPISFRFAYESLYRSRWDRGESADLVVMVNGSREDIQRLPFDLVQSGRIASFALEDLFPNLRSSVLHELERSDLDALYQAQSKRGSDKLSDYATRDFVLQHVFGISPALIKQPVDLLRTLLSLHYTSRILPPSLEQHLLNILRGQHTFDDWPLEQILSDRNAFFAFLQERWPIFLDQLARKSEGRSIRAPGATYNLQFSGPEELPFAHGDIRVYIDTLFFDGILHPVSHPAANLLSQQWVAVGMHIDPSSDRSRRLEGLLQHVEQSVPTADARHREWLNFAYRWAELSVLKHSTSEAGGNSLDGQYTMLRDTVDQAFLAWVERRYAGLANQPPLPPVMVHHIPRALARIVEQSPEQRIALLVLDGLALDQWIVLREALVHQQKAYQLHEDAAFAWLPTITQVSRQAIFAGKPPLFFASSISTTSKEPALWSQCWSEWQLASAEVAYIKGLGAPDSLALIQEEIAHPKLRMVGLVIDTVDKIMHGMQLGTAGMHNQVQQWAANGFLAKLLELLFDAGFSVFLTSDHGNIEARGCGNPNEGMVAELRAGRVRVYTERTLRSIVEQRFPTAVAWEPIGLPPDYYPLFAPNRAAFVTQGERIVAHGGVSLEEVIVPFVQFERILP